jgi:predicted ATPase
MYISHFQVRNYKSFYKPQAVEFTPGFNIVSGQNNSGKTALLEALGLSFTARPHRSLETVPTRDRIPHPDSLVDVSFTLSPEEVKELMLASGSTQFSIATPVISSEFAKRIVFRDNSAESLMRLLDAVFSQEFLTFNLRLSTTAPQNTLSWSSPEIPTFGLYTASRNTHTQILSASFNIDRDGTFTYQGNFVAGSSDFGTVLAPSFQKHVYRFAAERMKVGKGAHGGSLQLARDASNLPEVLNQLQSNPSRFRQLNQKLRSILPQVQQVSVRGTGHGEVEINVWSHDPESQREDIAVPLAECGTGIGQVLAILYVVMTSERPQTIIIDEPQSFLHPGAARKLIEFLKDYSQHQFVVATHSATIISAANPKTIILARFEEAETTLVQLDALAEKGIQTTLAELGVRLSDMFGADNILWVEGATEEKCFRLIIEKLLSQRLMGTQLLGIRQVGDLEGRDAKRVFEIYRSLTKGASLLPPALAFILDQECRDEDAKKELNKLSGNLTRFIPRRMYENYLLNPDALAEVANSIEGFRTPPLQSDEVRDALESKLNDPAYSCPRDQAKPSSDRIKQVDGARVLKELFGVFSGQRVEYQKIKHGIALTDYLIRNAPQELEEIVQLLTDVLKVD